MFKFIERQKVKRENSLNGGAAKFAHYTSVEAAVSIFQNSEIWLRNAINMNDYTEIKFGVDRIAQFFNKDTKQGAARRQRFNDFIPGIFENAASIYDQYLDDLKFESYILSLSKFDEQNESDGKLSMWRGYGGRSAVAIVLNSQAFNSDSNYLGIYSNEVNYLSEVDFDEVMQSFIDAIPNEPIEQTPQNVEQAVWSICYWLSEVALCTKHKGF
ncbi:MAG: hypothetical protein AAF429_03750 [Pseudomonadota bacterium]